MSTNYSQYLGTRKCCDLKVQGPQGPQGAQGPSAVGGMGYQGATGATGPQGATGRGCRGATGAQGYQGATGEQGFQGATGATGASQWISMNGVGGSTGGYTGIGYTGDVLIYGNLLVTGGIDPTYLALTPQPSGPQGFINPLWVDISGNLRSEKILLANGINTLAIDETRITHSNATLPLDIVSDNAISIYTPNNNIGISTTYTSLSLDDINKNIFLGGVGSTFFNIDLSSNVIAMYGGGGIEIESGNGSGLGNITLTANDPSSGVVIVNATNGIVINQQGITPPNTIKTTLNGQIIDILEYFNTTTGIVKQTTIATTDIYIVNTDNTAGTESYGRLAPNLLEVYDQTSSGTNNSRLLILSTEFEYQRAGTIPTFYDFRCGGGSVFRMNNNGINMGALGTGVQLRANHIQYPATYNTSSATLTTTQNVSTSNAVQTFNGSSLTATLPNASATNVGTQYTITNTNASNLTVTTVGGTQLIYSSTAPASATSRTLAQGNSQIFTAILTTGSGVYGWSMV